MQLGDFWPGNHVPEKSFANHVEKLAGDILHACELQWYYEPTTFPLEMDEQGKMKKGFRQRSAKLYAFKTKKYVELKPDTADSFSRLAQACILKKDPD